MGYPDLDLRPAPMRRDTMKFWVIECPECRCVQKADGREKVDLEFIRSGEYRALIHALLPDTANRYHRLAVLMVHMGKHNEAAEAYRCAAWDCDDHGYDREAFRFRERAADQYLPERYEYGIADVQDGLCCVDLLRRSRQFYRAGELADSLLPRLDEAGPENNREMMEKVLKFQKQLCAKGDVVCYTLGAVLAEFGDLEAEAEEPESEEDIELGDSDAVDPWGPWGPGGEVTEAEEEPSEVKAKLTEEIQYNITNTDYWFKIVDFLQQNWGVIESAEDKIIVYFFGDTASVFREFN